MPTPPQPPGQQINPTVPDRHVQLLVRLHIDANQGRHKPLSAPVRNVLCPFDQAEFIEDQGSVGLRLLTLQIDVITVEPGQFERDGLEEADHGRFFIRHMICLDNRMYMI